MTESGNRASKGMCRTSLPGGDRDLFLKGSRDIEYAKEHGRRISTALFNMVICRTDGGTSRIGIVVGKRFGGAVSRNRAKRLFRELTRQLRGHLLTGYNLVVFPKRDSIVQPFAVLKEMWLASLQRQRLLRIQKD
ncbi:MAG: ribonuclease P protein component [Nitrospirae bacterium]|nr:ribonuclease P protein component [Nitrospirota bacterium]